METMVRNHNIPRGRNFTTRCVSRRHVGGKIPPCIEIRNPGLGVHVKIDVPREYMEQPEEGGTMFTPENLIKLCTTALGSVPDWSHLILNQMQQGKKLELAWRLDTQLDWVWQNQCVDGARRNWAVLCGLALKQASHCLQFTHDTQLISFRLELYSTAKLPSSRFGWQNIFPP